jgi:hypothetical protein
MLSPGSAVGLAEPHPPNSGRAAARARKNTRSRSGSGSCWAANGNAELELLPAILRVADLSVQVDCFRVTDHLQAVA